MAVQVNGVNDYINFGDVSALNISTIFSIMKWIYPDSNVAPPNLIGGLAQKNDDVITKGWQLSRNIHSNGNPSWNQNSIIFAAGFNTPATGVWGTPTNSCVINTKYHVAVVYDPSSFSNKPVIYINGISQSITTYIQPASGSYGIPSTFPLEVCGIDSGGGGSSHGKSEDFRFYSRGLSSSEISTENSAGPNPTNPNQNGLVFYAPLWMAHGLTISNFAGTTLAAGNTFRDDVNCAVGTPTGSPVGAAAF